MRHRALVLTKPQTPDNFLSVYMDGSLTIIELDQWATQMWIEYGIVLFPSNSNLIPSTAHHSFDGPDPAA